MFVVLIEIPRKSKKKVYFYRSKGIENVARESLTEFEWGKENLSLNMSGKWLEHLLTRNF